MYVWLYDIISERKGIVVKECFFHPTLNSETIS